jgi:hypothetical protein
VRLKPRGVPHAFWNATDEPARLLEIISPAGFERYFAESEELVSGGGPPDLEALAGPAERYGLDMDFASVPRLAGEYGLDLDPVPVAVGKSPRGRPQAARRPPSSWRRTAS